jgi:uncharacterized protein YjiS (DUF1127 family)
MFKLIDALLGKSRTRARISRVEHLDARLLADIGLTREDFRRYPTKKTA